MKRTLRKMSAGAALAAGMATAAQAAPEAIGPQVTLRLPSLGQQVLRQKTFDPETGAHGGWNTQILADGSRRPISDADVEALLRSDREAQRRSLGALVPSFDRVVRRAAPTTRFRFMAVAAFDPDALPRRPDMAGRTAEEVDRLRAAHRDAVARAASTNVAALERAIASRGGRVLRRATVGPFVYGEMSASGLLDLARQTALVRAIHQDGQVLRDELENSTCAMGADILNDAGLDGGGLNVAVLEGGRVDSPLTCLDVIGSYDDSVGVTNHATGVAGIIASSMAGATGVAPGADILTVPTGDIEDGLEWALDSGAEVVNMSFGTSEGGVLTDDDVVVDYFVRNMATTIVKSAGNRGAGNTCPNTDNVTNPGLAFNIITVGNLNDNGVCDPTGAAYTMSTGSCFNDPASAHGDREKPELAAPGTAILTLTSSITSNCMTGNPGASGTSFAAPHVSGSAALLIDREPDLAFWPEAIKALLMATAWYNVEGAAQLSERDGVGGIDAASAEESLRRGRFVAETWSKSSFDANGERVLAQFEVKPQTSRLKIAMAWSTYGDTDQDTPTSDVDLRLERFGQLVTQSASFDNNYEVLDIADPQPGWYTLRARVASGTLKTDDDAEEYGAVAWGLVEHPCVDDGFDFDLDGVCGDVDNCPSVANAGQADGDGDGVGSACDNCPGAKNADQADMDDDGQGDVCDGDIDGDGCLNASDEDANDASEHVGYFISATCNPKSGLTYGDASEDTDGDGVKNCEDPDNDDDDQPDAEDPCPVGKGLESWQCTEAVDCGVQNWWDACMLGGGCFEILVAIVSVINPDPTLVFENIQILDRTLFIQAPRGSSVAEVAEVFAGAGHQRIELRTREGRMVHWMADYAPTQLFTGDLSAGTHLAVRLDEIGNVHLAGAFLR